MKENNDHAFAMRREQDRTRDAVMATKRLEGTVGERDKQIKRMQTDKEVVSCSFVSLLVIVAARASQGEARSAAARDQLPRERDCQAQ